MMGLRSWCVKVSQLFHNLRCAMFASNRALRYDIVALDQYRRRRCINPIGKRDCRFDAVVLNAETEVLVLLSMITHYSIQRSAIKFCWHDSGNRIVPPPPPPPELLWPGTAKFVMPTFRAGEVRNKQAHTYRIRHAAYQQVCGSHI